MIPEVKEAWDAFAHADLMGMAMDQGLGGAQLPATVAEAGFAWFSAANISTTGYLMLTMANANLLAKFGTRGADRRLRPADADGPVLRDDGAVGDAGGLVAGRHPHPCRAAGRRHVSALRIQDVDLRAPNTRLPENIVNLVLAKIPGGPPGTKGISLFIVPKYLVNADGSVGERNDVVLAGLNHKMGQRGITNTVLNFGEGKFTPRRRSRRGGLPGRRAAPRAGLHVPP